MAPYKGIYTHLRYTEATVSLKSLQDTAWYASALEGLATTAIVEAWLNGQGLVRLLNLT